MKKIALLTGLLLSAVITFAQVKELSETTVESPKYIGQQDANAINSSESSPICSYLKSSLINNNFEEGVVIILFTINADGTLSDFNVKNSVSKGSDQKVINCLKSTSGLWNPGRVNGTPVEMQKEIHVRFVDPSGNSLEELAQNNIESAVKQFESAKAIKNNVSLTSVKADKKSTRKLQSALAYLKEASKYQPNEPSVVFWEACTYEELGNEMRKAEKLNRFMEMVDPKYQAGLESVDIHLN